MKRDKTTANILTDMFPHEVAQEGAARDSAGDLLEALGVPGVDPETPGRMARALRELVAGYAVTDLAGILKTFPAPADPGVVVVRDLPFASLCEHHVLPFTGTVSVAYIPRRTIVGLSKIPRLVRAVTRRLQVQERIGQVVADTIATAIKPIGVMVVVRSRHSCMGLRGVESPGEMVTSCVRGAFKDQPAARAEALVLIGVGR